MKEQPRYKDLPRYEITFEDDGIQGIKKVSLVKDPATEEKGKYFSKQVISEYQFKVIPEKQIVVGYAMVPDKDILRKTDGGDFYYVYLP